MQQVWLYFTRVITVLTDLGAHLTQDLLLATDQRLWKPFFDIQKNQGKATSQSYFIEIVYLLTLRDLLSSVFPNIKKWFFVNVDQWPKVHFVSNIQPDLWEQ